MHAPLLCTLQNMQELQEKISNYNPNENDPMIEVRCLPPVVVPHPPTLLHPHPPHTPSRVLLCISLPGQLRTCTSA